MYLRTETKAPQRGLKTRGLKTRGLKIGPLKIGLLISALPFLLASNTPEPTIRVSLGTFPQVKIQIKTSVKKIKCHGKKTSLLASFYSPQAPIQINGKSYRHQIKIYGKKNQCLVVNTLPLEQYIAGVVGNEMHPSWPMEALKAQSIVARSYALAKKRERKSRNLYDVVNSTNDQVYGGIQTEFPQTNKATKETKGTVLFLPKRNIPFKTYYHANCGGQTITPKEAWGRKGRYPYLSIPCPYHNKSTRWSHTSSLSEIEKTIRKTIRNIPQDFTRLAYIGQHSFTKSNRAKNITLMDGKGRKIKIPAYRFRKALGQNQLKSTKFQLLHYYNKLEFRGRGHGHAVGLCQYGAKRMAELGKDHNTILQYYYPLAKISKLY